MVGLHTILGQRLHGTTVPKLVLDSPEKVSNLMPPLYPHHPDQAVGQGIITHPQQLQQLYYP